MAETFSDLVDLHLGGRSRHVYATEVLGIGPKTLYRLESGLVKKPHAGTVAVLVLKMRLPEERVRAAIQASYDEAH